MIAEFLEKLLSFRYISFVEWLNRPEIEIEKLLNNTLFQLAVL